MQPFLLGIAVTLAPSVICVAWLIWQSGAFDPRQRDTAREAPRGGFRSVRANHAQSR